ncbi:MAG: hypothetical protein CL916_02840 [Deltaproteobacteria bacterium]|nr:hypothetical protein [Deltaproteobacteria bacterium]
MKFTLTIDCPQKWDSMKGDDQIRHCGMCKKNIHNLEEYREEEAHSIIEEGTNCVRMEANHRGQIKTISGFSKSLLLMGLAMGCGDTSQKKTNSTNPDNSQVEKPLEINVGEVNPLHKVEETGEVQKEEKKPHFVGKVAPKKGEKKEQAKDEESKEEQQ